MPDALVVPGGMFGPAADHGLAVPGPVAATVAMLETMVTRLNTFLARTVWP